MRVQMLTVDLRDEIAGYEKLHREWPRSRSCSQPFKRSAEFEWLIRGYSQETIAQLCADREREQREKYIVMRVTVGAEIIHAR